MTNNYIQTLITDSGVPPVEHVTDVLPSLDGLTVICPQKYVYTIEDELGIRNVAANLLINWVNVYEEPGVWSSYTLDIIKEYKNNIEKWKSSPIVAWVGWGFRGLGEQQAAVLNDCLLYRMMEKLPTIVTCSVDPMLLTPKWNSDRPVVSLLRKPAMRVRYTCDNMFNVERRIK